MKSLLNSTIKSIHWKEYLLLVISMFFWGLSWPLTKILVSYATSFQLGFFRFLIAGVIFLCIFFIRYRKQNKVYSWQTWFQFGILGLLGIFGYGILFLTAMRFTTSAQGAVIAGIQPAMISILAGLIHHERLQPAWRYWGLLFSFLGVILIIGIQPFLNFNRDHFIGNLIVVIAFLCFASYSVYGKTVMQSNDSYETTTWATVIGMGLFAMSAVVENKWAEVQLNHEFLWVGIIILGVGTTVIAFFSYFYAINRIGATKTGIFINLVPVFGTLTSVWLLNEQLTWTLWVGMILISIGIGFINFPRNSNSK
ncbi:MAG: hypothetical protein DRO88_01475 [Promethearchaeia archaeon]|nr:MAG: hypothetical protein DRO88_01475 [Candidatus Lokiarchaeia archaeon]